MVAYHKTAFIKPRTKVRILENTGRFGEIGTVVSRPEGRIKWSTSRPDVRITWVQFEDLEGPIGYFTDDLERVEDMSSTTLVGPKPEPAKEPQHPTPWKAEGRRILDANGREVFRIRSKAASDEVPMAVAYELARVVANAVSAKFAPAAVKDSDSPF